MREQLARFRYERRIAIESGVRFARRFGSGIVFRSHVGHSLPLRFAVYAIERLVTGISQFEKTIGPLLDRRSGANQRRANETKRTNVVQKTTMHRREE